METHSTGLEVGKGACGRGGGVRGGVPWEIGEGGALREPLQERGRLEDRCCSSATWSWAGHNLTIPSGEPVTMYLQAPPAEASASDASTRGRPISRTDVLDKSNLRDDWEMI